LFFSTAFEKREKFLYSGNFHDKLEGYVKIPSKRKAVKYGPCWGKMEEVHFLGIYEEKKTHNRVPFLGPDDIMI
jgi:hypothetical protein